MDEFLWCDYSIETVFLFLCLYDKMWRIKKIFHGKQILVVGSLWADPLANLKQLVNSFISLLARILAKETGRFDTNSSSEIAQKF